MMVADCIIFSAARISCTPVRSRGIVLLQSVPVSILQSFFVLFSFSRFFCLRTGDGAGAVVCTCVFMVCKVKESSVKSGELY